MFSSEFSNFIINLDKRLQITKQNLSDPLEILKSIHYGNSIPTDSVDRVFALYLVTCHQELLDSLNEDIILNKDKLSEFYSNMDSQIKLDFEGIKYIAYENYEREGISDLEAFGNLVYVAKKGESEVLKDSYRDGGWFGSS